MVSVGLATRVLTGRTERRAYVVAPHRKTPVATVRERHLMNRFSYGPTPALLTQMRALGGPVPWFERQLVPGSIRESAAALALPGWFPDLAKSAAQIAEDDSSGAKGIWEYARDLSNYSLLRRMSSRRGVHESMVEFWSNHLHVESTHNRAGLHRPAYDALIREHALGRFDDLLVAATLHPAMLLYLDNWRSVRGAPNENHGRELLELHTVGVGAGYTEAMVKDSAKILSGYTVRTDTWEGVYDPSRHTTGAVSVLGFERANAAADGSALAVDYLRHLARHPATARRVVRELAIRFVRDDPSDALVEELAAVYLSSGTDIAVTLRALVGSPEFWSSVGQKVRTPADDVVATCRALGVRPLPPQNNGSFAHALSWTLDSTLVYQWPRPDGAPEGADAWTSPTRMLNSWRMHWNFAGGWWPTQEVRYRKHTWFLPQKRIRFDKLVDHLSRRLLGRRSTARLLQACCEAVDVAPGEIITRSHPVIDWKLVRLLGVLLDSPAHMTR